MISKLALLVCSTYAEGGATWNYKTNGADWKDVVIDGKTNECALPNQSPINLISKGSDDFKYKIYDKDDDMFTKVYSNQAGNPKWNGHTNQVNLDTSADSPTKATAPSNTFTSNIASQIFGADDEFEGQ